MNFIIASKQKSLFIKKAFGVACVAATFIAALFLAGCSNAVGYDAEETAAERSVLVDSSSIYGDWLYSYGYTSGGVYYSGYEGYEITGSGGTGTLSYTFDSNGSDYGLSFIANIVDIVYNVGYASGVIIIKYTTPPADGDVGKYNAVYFQNLTAGTAPAPDTVQLANAVNLSDYSNSEVDSEGEADTNFTWANVGNYITWSVVNPQSRQP